MIRRPPRSTLSLHDALPISEDLADAGHRLQQIQGLGVMVLGGFYDSEFDVKTAKHHDAQDRKSTRLNSSHVRSSYAVLCLTKIRTLNGSYYLLIAADMESHS